MADLLEQVAQLPQSHHSKPRYPAGSRPTPCPKCGGIKAAISKQCLRCRLLSNRSPDRPELFIVDGEPCRWIPLTKGRYAIIDADLYDSLIGQFWHVSRAINGTYYAATTTPDHKCARMHHVVSNFELVDHKNGNSLDNRKSNLRPCETNGENSCNRKMAKNNTSGFMGVNKSNSRWMSRIMKGRASMYLGTFDTKIEAALIRDIAAAKYHGEFAVFNFPLLNDETRQMVLSALRANEPIPDHHDALLSVTISDRSQGMLYIKPDPPQNPALSL